jgi:hypothetical protein
VLQRGVIVQTIKWRDEGCKGRTSISDMNWRAPWSRVLLEKLILHLVSQEIPHLLWNPKAYYRVPRSPLQVPFLSQVNPVHHFQPYFPKIHFNISLPSTPRPSTWSSSFRFYNQNFVRLSRLVLRFFSSLCHPEELPVTDPPTLEYQDKEAEYCRPTVCA